jgi:hypothetical protein
MKNEEKGRAIKNKTERGGNALKNLNTKSEKGGKIHIIWQ